MRFFAGCKMQIFIFFVIQQRSEGSHFLMFFEKKEKEEILRFAQNGMDDTIVILLRP
jgi:hypothetical protein